MSSAVPPPDADSHPEPGAVPDGQHPTGSALPEMSAPAPMERRVNADTGAAHHETVARRDVLVRRAPRFAPFLVGGALIGFVVAAVVVFPAAEDPQYTPAATFGFFAMVFGALGVALGALIALALDRRSHRRARRGSADEVTGVRP